MATRTWTGADGVNTNWDDIDNWAEGAVPTNADDVVWHASPTNANMTLNVGTANCKTFNTSACSGAKTISGTSFLYVYGNFTLDNNVTWTSSGVVSIQSNAGVVTSSGRDLSSLASFSADSGGDILLNGDLNLGAKSFFIRGGNCNLDTTNGGAGNYNVTCGTWGDMGTTGNTTLTLGSSTINCTNVSFGSATLTVSDNTATINVACVVDTTMALNNVDWGGASFVVTYSPTTADAHAINFTGTSCVLGKLDINLATDRRDCSVAFNNNFTLENDSTWKAGGAGYDDPTIRLLIKSSAIGTARTCAMAANMDLTITDCDMQDITVTVSGTGAVAGTRVGDCGGNTGCDCDAPKTVYIDYGTANCNWSDAIWSTSSGGGSPSLNNFPLPQDTAVIDNSSWDDTGNTMTVNAPRIGGITATDLTEAQTLASSLSPTVYGSLLLNTSALSVGWGGRAFTFDARVATTLNINITDTDTDANVVLDSRSGTVVLTGNYGSGRTFTITRGTFDLNGNTLSVRDFTSSTTNEREIKDSVGGGKIVVNGLTGTIFNMGTATNLTVSDAPDIQIGSGALTLAANVTVEGGGKTFGDFTVKKHAGNFDCILTGANTFAALTLETPDATYQYSDLQLTASTTTTCTSLVIDGTADYKPNFASTTSTHAVISDSSGTNTVTNCLITAVNAAGGATFTLGTGASIADDETGWTTVGGVSIPVFMHHYLHNMGRK